MADTSGDISGQSRLDRRNDTGEGALKVITNVLPDRWGVQLLRSAKGKALKQGGDTHQRYPRLCKMGMHAGRLDRRLTRMFGSAPDRSHQPRTAGDRLTTRIGRLQQPRLRMRGNVLVAWTLLDAHST